MANLKITLVKSPISSLKDQQDTVKACIVPEVSIVVAVDLLRQ